MILTGLQQVARKLSDLGTKVEKKITRRALRSGGKVVLAAAKSQTPVRSGMLARNLKIRAGKSTKDTVSLLVGAGKKWYTGPAFYAAFVFFGHRVGPRRLGNSRKLVPANNAIERAYESSAASAVQVIEQTMVTEIEAAAAGGAP